MASKTVRIPKPKSGQVDTYFLASDWHDFYLNLDCLHILEKVAKTVPKKNRKLIIPGDFLDAPDFMTKALAKHKKETIVGKIESFYIPKAEEAFLWGNEILDRLQKIFPEIIFMEGNHDWRFSDFMNRFSPKIYHPYFDLKSNLMLEERGIKHIKYNYWLDIGPLFSITHGMYHGTSALKKHYEASGKNVVFGHVHKEESKSFVRRGDTIKAWSLPCMCDMNPPYLKDTETNWSNGFAIMNMRDDGKFNLWPALVIDGKLTMPDGTTYEG